MKSKSTQTETDVLDDGKMCLLGQLLGSVIHEVNNPLAIGMGRMQQLKSLIDLTNPDVQKMATSMTLQFERMRDILIAAKRVASFGNNQVIETITTKSIVSTIEVLLAERCRRHGVTLVFEERPLPWQVEGSIDGVVTLIVAVLLESVEFLKTQNAEELPPITLTFSNASIIFSWPFSRSFVRNEYTHALISKLGLKLSEIPGNSGASHQSVLTFSEGTKTTR